MISQDVKQFIEENIDNIELNEFDLVYERALDVRYRVRNIGELTDALLAAGINPLDYMDNIPILFLDESSITSFVVPEHIEVIRNLGLAFSKLENVLLHNNVELSQGCLKQSSIKSVIIPSIMNEVPDECFSGCSELQDVDLNAIEQIGSDAFYACKSLGKLYIPDDIKFISSTAFDKCLNLVFLIHNNNEYVVKYAKKHNIKVEFI